MKRVLVTGASGFVGRHTLKPLLEKNYEVHAISSCENFIEEYPEVIWHFVNLHDHIKIENLIQTLQPSHLLHLAWYAKPKEYWTSPLNLKWLNSSLHLLNQFIAAAGKRAVFAGTCAEYDWQYQHCHEYLTPCLPSTLYGSAKHALYLLCQSLTKQNNISFAWGRIFFLFGLNEYAERLIPSAIHHFFNNKSFSIKNSNQVRDFLFVADAADALVSLLDTSITGPVNIASGQSLKLGELIAKIAKKINHTSFIQSESDQSDLLTADVTRLFNEVNWRPNYSLDNAIDETIAWWQAQHALLQ